MPRQRSRSSVLSQKTRASRRSTKTKWAEGHGASVRADTALRLGPHSTERKLVDMLAVV